MACYWCAAEPGQYHMVDCPGLMPPASHVPAMGMPGVEDEGDAQANAPGPIPLSPTSAVELNDRTGDYELVDANGMFWRWDADAGWICVGVSVEE